MKNQVTSGLESLRKAFEIETRENPRVRKMGWLVGYILCGYIISGLYDFNSSLEEQAFVMQSEISRIMRGAKTPEETWKARLNDERAIQNQITQFCWNTGDPRLASADMQTALQKLYRDYDINNSRLALSDPETIDLDGPSLVWIIRAEVKGRMALNRLPSLVNSLENSENRFFVQELQFAKQRNSGTLNLNLAACFIPGQSDE